MSIYAFRFHANLSNNHQNVDHSHLFNRNIRKLIFSALDNLSSLISLIGWQESLENTYVSNFSIKTCFFVSLSTSLQKSGRNVITRNSSQCSSDNFSRERASSTKSAFVFDVCHCLKSHVRRHFLCCPSLLFKSDQQTKNTEKPSMAAHVHYLYHMSRCL